MAKSTDLLQALKGEPLTVLGFQQKGAFTSAFAVPHCVDLNAVSEQGSYNHRF